LRLSARIFLAALLLSAHCLAQSRDPYESSTEDNVYTNFFFRFRYSFTASWVAQPMDVGERMQKAGQSGLADDDKEVIISKEGKHYSLLSLSRTLPGQGVNGRSHAMFQIVAEDLSSHREIASGKECVLQTTERLKKAHYTPVGEPKEVKISGQTFFRQDFKGRDSSGTPVFQSSLFTVTRGYAVGFILVSPTQLTLNNMVETMDKVEFY
jgi:hypothetical protein